MAAEALWILDGSDQLSELVRYNPNMAAFSDDGVTLAGAYGPRIMPQIPYVVSKLREDRDTRQAALTIWTPSPAPSKDIPCTVAMDFKVRDGKLNLHVFMRSSDIWLGLPYDVFSFSCVAYLVCSILGDVTPGTLYLTAASSHLYERHWGEKIGDPPETECLSVPETYWSRGPSNLKASLKILRDSRKGDVARWWER
jgi:thymidylate synthase